MEEGVRWDEREEEEEVELGEGEEDGGERIEL